MSYKEELKYITISKSALKSLLGVNEYDFNVITSFGIEKFFIIEDINFCLTNQEAIDQIKALNVREWEHLRYKASL